jgi:subtilisin family serine protease
MMVRSRTIGRLAMLATVMAVAVAVVAFLPFRTTASAMTPEHTDGVDNLTPPNDKNNNNNKDKATVVMALQKKSRDLLHTYGMSLAELESILLTDATAKVTTPATTTATSSQPSSSSSSRNSRLGNEEQEAQLLAAVMLEEELEWQTASEAAWSHIITMNENESESENKAAGEDIHTASSLDNINYSMKVPFVACSSSGSSEEEEEDQSTSSGYQRWQQMRAILLPGQQHQQQHDDLDNTDIDIPPFIYNSRDKSCVYLYTNPAPLWRVLQQLRRTSTTTTTTNNNSLDNNSEANNDNNDVLTVHPLLPLAKVVRGTLGQLNIIEAEPSLVSKQGQDHDKEQDVREATSHSNNNSNHNHNNNTSSAQTQTQAQTTTFLRIMEEMTTTEEEESPQQNPPSVNTHMNMNMKTSVPSNKSKPKSKSNRPQEIAVTLCDDGASIDVLAHRRTEAESDVPIQNPHDMPEWKDHLLKKLSLTSSDDDDEAVTTTMNANNVKQLFHPQKQPFESATNHAKNSTESKADTSQDEDEATSTGTGTANDSSSAATYCHDWIAKEATFWHSNESHLKAHLFLRFGANLNYLNASQAGGETKSSKNHKHEQHSAHQQKECLIHVLAALSQWHQVCQLEIVSEMTTDNRQAQWMVQSGGVEDQRPWFDYGLDGKDQLVAVSDTGVDTDNCYFWDSVNADHFQPDGSYYAQQRKVVEYTFSAGTVPDLEYGHGTHVAGTIAGRKSVNGKIEALDGQGMADGIAPQAKLAVYNAGYSGE